MQKTEKKRTRLDYFENQLKHSNVEYWERIGYKDVKGKSVLDIGCSHGALSVDVAQQGAERVLGIDIEPERIKFAQDNVQTRFPEIADKVSFQLCAIEELEDQFDMAISKDAFEHIEDLSTFMTHIARILTDDGVLVTGFSPLFYSPYGDHRLYSEKRLPWLPVLLPRTLLNKMATRRNNRLVSSEKDLGLNKLTPKEFRDILAAQKWRVLSLEYNRGGRAGMSLMRLFRRIPFLEKFFTVNIYAVLQAPLRN